MGAETKIEWTHHTFSPWWGCAKVSRGCTHCYAEAVSNRFGRAAWGLLGTRVIASDRSWAEPLKWDRAAQKAGERRKVFCASMADVFEDRPDLAAPRDQLFELIGDTPHLAWLLLTKRPQDIARLMWPPCSADVPIPYLGGGDYLPNVWLGTSIEDQETADKRIPELLQIRAAVRFLSVEPLLGPVDLTDWLHDGHVIDWVIVGGESGPNARPCNVVQIRDIVQQCAKAGVPCFVKQLGARPYALAGDGFNADESVPVGCFFDFHDRKGGDPSEWPEGLRVRQWPDLRPQVSNLRAARANR